MFSLVFYLQVSLRTLAYALEFPSLLVRLRVTTPEDNAPSCKHLRGTFPEPETVSHQRLSLLP